MTERDEIELAELLAFLPPAPEAWVAAAQALPAARAALDGLVARARDDAAARAAILADLEGALRDAGAAPRPALVEQLREQLGD